MDNREQQGQAARLQAQRDRQQTMIGIVARAVAAGCLGYFAPKWFAMFVVVLYVVRIGYLSWRMRPGYCMVCGHRAWAGWQTPEPPPIAWWQPRVVNRPKTYACQEHWIMLAVAQEKRIERERRNNGQ